MLIEASTLIKCTAQNIKGGSSKVSDIYFDESDWKIHHFIIDLNHWLRMHSRFLVSPNDIEGMDSTNSVIFTSLTNQQIKQKPSNKLDIEISNKMKTNKHTHPMKKNISKDLHYLSTKKLLGYHVLTSNETVGSLRDLTADNIQWSFTHLIIDTENESKKQLTVPTTSVKNINLKEKTITIDINEKATASDDKVEEASRLHHD